MRALAFPSVIAAIGVAVACGQSSSDACGRLYDALSACNAPVVTVAPADRERDRARFVGDCEARLQLPGTSMTASWVAACADAIPSIGCLPIELEFDACAPKPGALPVGAACQDDAQCASTICSSAGGGCGRCLDATPEGGDCPGASLAPCVAGTTCIASTCSRADFAAEGESCDDTTTFCQKDLVCFAQICSPPQPLGAPCFRYGDCAVGLTCSNASPQGGTCVAVPAPVYASAGGACSADVPCLVGDCGAGGTCPTPIADGQPCSLTSGPPCDSFDDCIDGTCRPSFSQSCP